jgi:hypothetical protein
VRVRRKRFILAVALSLPLCAAVALLWVRSRSTPRPNDVERLSALDPRIKTQWVAYRTKEGDAHRSDEFANLAMLLDGTCFSGTWMRSRTKPAARAKEKEVLSFLGLPDRGGSKGRAAMYVYSYWRPDTNSRWVAIVEIKDGLLEQIGWNDASGSDFSKLRQYRTWSDVPALAR